jgi:hypothetical protein
LKIEEVIKAFLLNLKKKNGGDTSKEDGDEFSNEDLLKFFAPVTFNSSIISKESEDNVDDDGLGQKICFALFKNKRNFMDINSLCDIK